MADPGFDLNGRGVDFVNGRVGRKSLKVLTVEVKVNFGMDFGPITMKISFKLNRERSDRKDWEKLVFGA